MEILHLRTSKNKWNFMLCNYYETIGKYENKNYSLRNICKIHTQSVFET